MGTACAAALSRAALAGKMLAPDVFSIAHVASAAVIGAGLMSRPARRSLLSGGDGPGARPMTAGVNGRSLVGYAVGLLALAPRAQRR